MTCGGARGSTRGVQAARCVREPVARDKPSLDNHQQDSSAVVSTRLHGSYAEHVQRGLPLLDSRLCATDWLAGLNSPTETSVDVNVEACFSQGSKLELSSKMKTEGLPHTEENVASAAACCRCYHPFHEMRPWMLRSDFCYNCLYHSVDV